jgi:uncharacterized protein YjeT (DUF2065 family)
MADRTARGLSLAPFRSGGFLLAAGCCVLYFGLEKAGYSLPFLRNYLNDLLCMPLVLSLTLFLQRTFPCRRPNHVFTKYQVGIAVAYYAVGFEGVLPLFMPRYTADGLDVVAYVLGGIFFYRFINVAKASPAD